MYISPFRFFTVLRIKDKHAGNEHSEEDFVNKCLRAGDNKRIQKMFKMWNSHVPMSPAAMQQILADVMKLHLTIFGIPIDKPISAHLEYRELLKLLE